MSDSPVFSSPSGSPKLTPNKGDDDNEVLASELEQKKPPVKILCLHGYASNPEILKRQISPIAERLPKSYEWHYLEGLASCRGEVADDDDDENGSSPKLCYYHTPSTHQIDKGHRYLWNQLLFDGPFDVILGFGQGAALAASFLLHEQLEENYGSQFKSAVLICPSSPFSKCLEVGYNARGMFGLESSVLDNILNRPVDIPEDLFATEDQKACPEHETTWRKETAEIEPEKAEIAGTTYNVGEPPCKMEGHLRCLNSREKYITDEKEEVDREQDRTFYQLFHCKADPSFKKVQIPTAHILGKKDPWYKHGSEMLSLFNRDNFHVTVQFDAGHEVSEEDAEEMVEDIKEAFREAGICVDED
ncbi:serine hydrolase-domain-containing protein [Cladorrhinum sp. PSN259]|nr:serine hydrolase-domain-containing protein [Cladorrhinum sp. PSN259]